MDSRQIEEQALAWLARRDGARWSAEDESALAAWLEADTAHRVAFLRLEAGWEKTARLKVIGAGMPQGVVPPRARWRVSPFFERTHADGAAGSRLRTIAPKIAALAASILAIAGAAIYLNSHPMKDRYTTPVGGVSSIPLEDGSKITLNTASVVRVALTDTQRRIELDAGEVFFDVAKDSSRPFVVDAGDRRIIAIGTQFSVRREGNQVRVVVTQGTVRVESRKDGEGAEILTAGAVLDAARDSLLVQKKTPREAEDAVSWRSGYLHFDETALADAVAEFNRYSTRRIVIEDAKLAGLRINGKFRATNADDFVQLLQNGFGIEAQRNGETITLSAQ